MQTIVYIATQLEKTAGRKLLQMLTVLLLVGLCTTRRVHASDDFTVQNRSWNGLSNFRTLVVKGGIKVVSTERVDIGKLLHDDALLIIHPTAQLPIHGLTRFMKKGGRLAIFDDYGASKEFLNAFEFGRFPPLVRETVRRLRNNDNLLIATAVARHPLAEKVSALVANHPQTLHHSELKPVFSFDRSGDSALVLVGAVGEGRLIAVSDSSLLINNMLEFRGNRVFARNLVRYLTKDSQSRLFIVTSDITLVDSDNSFTPRNSLDGIRQALLLLSRHQLSPLAVYTLTGVILSLMLLVAATALPRSSPYIAYANLIKRTETLAGFWGRVKFFSQRNRNLLNPLLVFRFELHEAIKKRFGLVKMPPLSELKVRLRDVDFPEKEIDQMQRLLRELDALHSRSDISVLPRVDRRKLRDLVTKGAQMLRRLDTTVKNNETRS